jgi:hypothetical protein
MIRINLLPQRPPPPRGGDGPPPALGLVLWVAALNAWLTVYHLWELCAGAVTMHRGWGVVEHALLALAVYALWRVLRTADRVASLGDHDR